MELYLIKTPTRNLFLVQENSLEEFFLEEEKENCKIKKLDLTCGICEFFID